MFTKIAARVRVSNREGAAWVDIQALEYRCWICSILTSYSGDLGFRSSKLPYVVFPDVSSFLTYTDYARVDFLQRRNCSRFWPSILPQRQIQKSHSLLLLLLLLLLIIIIIIIIQNNSSSQGSYMWSRRLEFARKNAKYKKWLSF
jgi:hypothetical protein